MKDFKEMTVEELIKIQIELDRQIQQIREEEMEKVYKRAVELVDELNALTSKYNIPLESVDDDGYKITLCDDIKVTKPGEW